MKRFGIELLGLLLAAGYWGQLLFLLYGQKYHWLHIVIGASVAVLIVARLAGSDWLRVSIGVLFGVIGGGLLLGGAVIGEHLAGGVGAVGGGLCGHVFWRLFVALVRHGDLWGVPSERRARWGTRIAEWGGLLASSGLIGLGVLWGTDTFAGEVKLQGYDAIALPGEPVRIAAKLQKQGVLGLNPDLHDVDLVFEVDGRPMGAVKTGAEGLAEIQVPIRETGVHKATVSITGDKHGRSGEDEFTIVVMDKDQEWAACDIDHTICDTDDWRFPFQKNDVIRPIPGAANALKEISIKIQPVYISGRDDVFMSKTRDWLQRYGFPKGPVFFMEWGIGETDVRKYKSAKIAEIAKKHPNVQVGFGDLPTDAMAYHDNKLTPYILRSKPPEDYPDYITPVNDWEEILSLLKKAGRL